MTSVEKTRQRLQELKDKLSAAAEAPPCDDDIPLRALYMLHRQWVAWHFALPEDLLACATSRLARHIAFETSGAYDTGMDSPVAMHMTADEYAQFLASVPDTALQRHADRYLKRTNSSTAQQLHSKKGWFPNSVTDWGALARTLAGEATLTLLEI